MVAIAIRCSVAPPYGAGPALDRVFGHDRSLTLQKFCTSGLQLGGDESCVHNSVWQKQQPIHVCAHRTCIYDHFDVAQLVTECLLDAPCAAAVLCRAATVAAVIAAVHATVAAIVWHYTQCFCCSTWCLLLHRLIADQYTLPCTDNLNTPKLRFVWKHAAHLPPYLLCIKFTLLWV